VSIFVETPWWLLNIKWWNLNRTFLLCLNRQSDNAHRWLSALTCVRAFPGRCVQIALSLYFQEAYGIRLMRDALDSRAKAKKTEAIKIRRSSWRLQLDQQE
jgi:hypothetical protein